MRADRWRDVLQTAVVVAIALTPAWFLPAWLSIPWQLLVLVLGLPAVLWTWRHAPFVPTPAADLPRILDALQLAPGQRFCDLGCGDGRVLLAVRRATGADCTGIEAAPHLALTARLRLALQGDAGTRVQWADLYRAELDGYDALYVWGTAYSVGSPAFRELVRGMRPGARLVSYHTPIPGLEPEAVDTEGLRPIHVYRVPASG